MPKRTFQPHSKKRTKKYGYRSRAKTHKGRLVLKRRSIHGRKKLTQV